MTQLYIYTGLAFGAGLITAWVIHILFRIKSKKAEKSLKGYLESEKLIRERYQKENTWLHELKETAQKEYEYKINELNHVIKLMDEDILLLQKSNEETEAMLHSKEPLVHSLKLKLIEANNTIARYKAQTLVNK